MAETYSGYVAPETVDWSALTTNLASKITKVGESIQKERTDLDKIAEDNIKKMNQLDGYKNQTFGTLMLTTINDGKNLINGWNKALKAGDMSSIDYRKKMSNLNEYTDILAGSAKNFDARIEEAMKEDNTAFGLEMLNEFGSLAEMKDAKFNISPDGSIMYSKVNPETGAIVGDLKDVRALNLPQNIKDVKLVLTDATKELTKNWEPYELFEDKGSGKTLTTESVMNNKNYQDMRATAIQALTTIPRRALSILADNGSGMVPVFYYTEEEKKQGISEQVDVIRERNRIANRENTEPTPEQMAEIEFNMVKKVQGPDGTINPELSEAQRTRAEEMAGVSIDAQLSKKMSGTTRNTGGSTDGGKTPEKQGYATYETINNGFNLSKTDPKRAAEMLTSLAGGRYKMRWVSGGLALYGPNEITGSGFDETKPVAIVKNGKELAPFVYGSTGAAGSDVALNQYAKEKEAYINSGKSSTNTGINTSNY
jgi:hypothetical protein